MQSRINGIRLISFVWTGKPRFGRFCRLYSRAYPSGGERFQAIQLATAPLETTSICPSIEIGWEIILVARTRCKINPGFFASIKKKQEYNKTIIIFGHKAILINKSHISQIRRLYNYRVIKRKTCQKNLGVIKPLPLYTNLSIRIYRAI